MLRKDKGVTQQEVIKQLGSRSQGYISQLESGAINMTLGTLVRFATALGYRTEVTFVPKPETE
jgi:transcriptional regulator with XRE-family HTH domain